MNQRLQAGPQIAVVPDAQQIGVRFQDVQMGVHALGDGESGLIHALARRWRPVPVAGLPVAPVFRVTAVPFEQAVQLDSPVKTLGVAVGQMILHKTLDGKGLSVSELVGLEGLSSIVHRPEEAAVLSVPKPVHQSLACVASDEQILGIAHDAVGVSKGPQDPAVLYQPFWGLLLDCPVVGHAAVEAAVFPIRDKVRGEG